MGACWAAFTHDREKRLCAQVAAYGRKLDEAQRELTRVRESGALGTR